MIATCVSAAFTTEKVEESRDFYVKHLGARVTFDCGWYVNLEFGSKSAALQFMSPHGPEHRLSDPGGSRTTSASRTWTPSTNG